MSTGVFNRCTGTSVSDFSLFLHLHREELIPCGWHTEDSGLLSPPAPVHVDNTEWRL